jgi:hypothetical protein
MINKKIKLTLQPWLTSVRCYLVDYAVSFQICVVGQPGLKLKLKCNENKITIKLQYNIYNLVMVFLGTHIGDIDPIASLNNFTWSGALSTTATISPINFEVILTVYFNLQVCATLYLFEFKFLNVLGGIHGYIN